MEIANVDASLVLAAHVQQSSVLNDHTSDNDICNEDYLSSGQAGVAVTSCGHAMHSKCYQIFMDNLVKTERDRLRHFHVRINFDVDENEFLCPLCKKLCNGVLPICEKISRIFTLAKPTSQSFYAFIERVKKVARNKVRTLWQHFCCIEFRLAGN